MPISGADVSTLQSAAAATGVGTALSVQGAGSVVFQVSGTFVGTVTWQATVDGTNWLGVAVADLASTTRARALTSTAPGLFLLDAVRGLQSVRANITAYTSGAIAVTAGAS